MIKEKTYYYDETDRRLALPYAIAFFLLTLTLLSKPILDKSIFMFIMVLPLLILFGPVSLYYLDFYKRSAGEFRVSTSGIQFASPSEEKSITWGEIYKLEQFDMSGYLDLKDHHGELLLRIDEKIDDFECFRETIIEKFIERRSVENYNHEFHSSPLLKGVLIFMAAIFALGAFYSLIPFQSDAIIPISLTIMTVIAYQLLIQTIFVKKGSLEIHTGFNENIIEYSQIDEIKLETHSGPKGGKASVLVIEQVNGKTKNLTLIHGGALSLYLSLHKSFNEYRATC